VWTIFNSLNDWWTSTRIYTRSPNNTIGHYMDQYFGIMRYTKLLIFRQSHASYDRCFVNWIMQYIKFVNFSTKPCIIYDRLDYAVYKFVNFSTKLCIMLRKLDYAVYKFVNFSTKSSIIWSMLRKLDYAVYKFVNVLTKSCIIRSMLRKLDDAVYQIC